MEVYLDQRPHHFQFASLRPCMNCIRAFWFARAHVLFPHISRVSLAFMHSGLAYTRVIHSKPNKCVCTYYYTMESIPFIGLELVMLTVLHFRINACMVSYGDIQMIMCILVE